MKLVSNLCIVVFLKNNYAEKKSSTYHGIISLMLKFLHFWGKILPIFKQLPIV